MVKESTQKVRHSDITVRTDRTTCDGAFVLVYEITEPKGRATVPVRHSYHWVEVATDETRSEFFETEQRASFWQEGYEFAAEVRKTEEKNAKRRKK